MRKTLTGANLNVLRRISYWALGVALLLLVVIATFQAINLQLDLERDERERRAVLVVGAHPRHETP